MINNFATDNRNGNVVDSADESFSLQNDLDGFNQRVTKMTNGIQAGELVK